MSGKIFVNYRHDDDPAAAARVRDSLAAKFGKRNLFMDIDSLLASQRFDEELAKPLADCDVLIAIIGQRPRAGTRMVDVSMPRSCSAGVRPRILLV